MEYRVIRSSDEDFDVITEDGGVSFHYHNGEHWVSNFYMARLTDLTETTGDIWYELGELGKIYVKDWPEDVDESTIIKEALEWLVMPAPDEWTINDKLFDNIY